MQPCQWADNSEGDSSLPYHWQAKGQLGRGSLFMLEGHTVPGVQNQNVATPDAALCIFHEA